jgi:splicing factor 3A subunit 1
VVIKDEAIAAGTATAADQPEVKKAKRPPVQFKEPPAFEFATDTPQISAQDLDIIKLTALFGARNGRQFLAQLVQREARNYQFDFLRPNHNLFPYFSHLLQQYTKILVPSAVMFDVMWQRIEDKHKTLERCVQRADWLRHVESNRLQQQEQEKAERDAYLSVDWNDFIVVQTIEINESETVNLPPPTTIHQLQAMPLVQRKQLMLQSTTPAGSTAFSAPGSLDTTAEMEI